MITFAPVTQWEPDGNVQMIGSVDKALREKIWTDLRVNGDAFERRCHRSTEVQLMLHDGKIVYGANGRAVYLTYYVVVYHRK